MFGLLESIQVNSMKTAAIVSIQVGMPRTLPLEQSGQFGSDKGASNWRTAFFKQPVSGPVYVGRETVAGDGQADLRYHGGEDRPVLAYCAEHYPRWESELEYPSMPFGGFGENFTVTGLDETTVCLGDRYAIGPIRVEVSQPRQPCSKLARRWQNTDLPALVLKHNRGGWYLRVLQEGTVEAGMSIELEERPYPQWTIANAMAVMYHGKNDIAAMCSLAELPPLSEQWRKQFAERLASIG
jgi:MOSC domain-containing protein YiiM